MKRIQIADHCICCDSTRLASAPAILMPFVAKRALGIDPVEITAEWGLRDLKQGTSYLPCHSLQCQTCGALFLDIRFTDAQMASLYHGYRDAAYNAQRDFFEPGYAATVANDYRHRHAYLDTLETWLAPHLPACPTVLDWGGGDGTNTPFLGKGTIHIHDISEVAPVAGATAAPPDSSDIPYDLIVCAQVLEHVPAPLELLQDILPRVAPGTRLYVEVPHEALLREHPDCLDLAPRKRHWHEHINFFTEPALHALFDRLGLSVLASHRTGFDNSCRKGEVMGFLLTSRAKPTPSRSSESIPV